MHCFPNSYRSYETTYVLKTTGCSCYSEHACHSTQVIKNERKTVRTTKEMKQNVVNTHACHLMCAHNIVLFCFVFFFLSFGSPFFYIFFFLFGRIGCGFSILDSIYSVIQCYRYRTDCCVILCVKIFEICFKNSLFWLIYY